MSECYKVLSSKPVKFYWFFLPSLGLFVWLMFFALSIYLEFFHGAIGVNPVSVDIVEGNRELTCLMGAFMLPYFSFAVYVNKNSVDVDVDWKAGKFLIDGDSLSANEVEGIRQVFVSSAHMVVMKVRGRRVFWFPIQSNKNLSFPFFWLYSNPKNEDVRAFCEMVDKAKKNEKELLDEQK